MKNPKIFLEWTVLSSLFFLLGAVKIDKRSRSGKHTHIRQHNSNVEGPNYLLTYAQTSISFSFLQHSPRQPGQPTHAPRGAHSLPGTPDRHQPLQITGCCRLVCCLDVGFYRYLQHVKTFCMEFVYLSSDKNPL